jgi:ribosome-associated protein
VAKLDTEEKLGLVKEAMDERKAENVEVIDLAGKTLIADYFVIASGTSNVHIRAIADGVMRKFKEHRMKRPNIEGYSQARWVLIDVGDVVVHVFAQEDRDYYDIESIWKQTEEFRGAGVTE